MLTTGTYIGKPDIEQGTMLTCMYDRTKKCIVVSIEHNTVLGDICYRLRTIDVSHNNRYVTFDLFRTDKDEDRWRLLLSCS